MKRAMLILLFAATACAVEGRTDTPTIDEPSGPTESVDPCHSDPVLGIAPSVAQCVPGHTLTLSSAKAGQLARVKELYPSAINLSIHDCDVSDNGFTCIVDFGMFGGSYTVGCLSEQDANGTVTNECFIDPVEE